jgi:pre-mRNA-processing factor 19
VSTQQTDLPGISCIDICPEDQNKIITTGKDGTLTLYDKAKGEQVSKTNFGQVEGKVCKFVKGTSTKAIIGGADKVARVVDLTNKGSVLYETKCHKSSITGAESHPINDYAIFSSKDGFWSFHNIEMGKMLQKVDSGSPISAMGLHVDGIILATGHQNGAIKIWDLRTQTVAHEVADDFG